MHAPCTRLAVAVVVLGLSAVPLRGQFLQREPDFDAAALEKCPIVDQVLRESMRYLTPVPMVFRNVLKTKSARLGKYDLPPNTVVSTP